LSNLKNAALKQKIVYEADREAILLKAKLDDAEKQELKKALPDIEDTLDRLFKIADQGVFEDGLRVIDLGAGHSSGSETLCGRIVAAMKAEALLNESVGAGYIDRNWPPAFKDTGAWPLASLRQSFLNGALTRLLDPDAILRSKIVEFVQKGDFGLASGPKPDGTYERLWHKVLVSPDEVAFEPGVLLIKKSQVEALKKASEKAKPLEEPSKEKPSETEPETGAEVDTGTGTGGDTGEGPEPDVTPVPTSVPIRVAGQVPPELWNRLGTRIVAKLRPHEGFAIEVVFSALVDGAAANDLRTELRQALADLGLDDGFTVE
jgi:hypothetical protein